MQNVTGTTGYTWEQKNTHWAPGERRSPLGWGEALAPEGEVMVIPPAMKVVPADTRKVGEGLDHTGVAEVEEAHLTIQTQEGEMDSIMAFEEDEARGVPRTTRPPGT